MPQNLPTELVIASHNAGKVKEIEDLLRPLGIKVEGAAALQLEEPEETGTTFVANAELKAMAACQACGKPALADDSGLAVAALDGAPGIYSARWASPGLDGSGRDFMYAMGRVEQALCERTGQAEGQEAAFICALALALPGGTVQHWEGKVEGALTFPPRGTKGFGYDPIFIPQGYEQTFGEMEPEAKHAMSHRARAFDAMMQSLQHRAP